MKLPVRCNQASRCAVCMRMPRADCGSVMRVRDWGGCVMGQFKCFGTEHGLLDNYISGIESDGDKRILAFLRARNFLGQPARVGGGICAGSGAGAGRGLRAERIVARISRGVTDTLQRQCGRSDGRLWFATRSGLVAANAGRVQPNRIPPAILIERVLLDGKPMAASRPASPCCGFRQDIGGWNLNTRRSVLLRRKASYSSTSSKAGTRIGGDRREPQR